VCLVVVFFWVRGTMGHAGSVWRFVRERYYTEGLS